MDERLERLARVQSRELAFDDRMMGNSGGKLRIDLLGSIRIAMHREEAGISVNKTKRALVRVVSGLEPAARLGGVSKHVGYQAAVIVAEGGDRGIANAIEGIERVMQVRLAGVAPCGKESRCDVPRATVG